jgi:type I restriction enzyme M protein
MTPTRETPEKPMPTNDNEAELRDFITGKPIRPTPEELDAVQVFAKRLVNDYDYPKERIQTRPQFRIRKRPSDEEKSYPVDIAVFRSSKRVEDDQTSAVIT